MNYIKLILMITVLLMTTACKNSAGSKQDVSRQDEKTDTEEALYRPRFHFTPGKNWMNDPNGMFYYNGNYHLYFQYYPDANVWGPMHWGHAVSKDLVRWTEQPVALYPDEKGYIFSGSAVVDINNTSGFGSAGNVPVVATFTYHDPEGEKAGKNDFQNQAIAYSVDEGMTWTKYEGNPVVKNPGLRDFRDPKVRWDAARGQWIMALAAGDEIMFYRSKNLKEWEQLSSFGKGIGAHGGVWECPDLFPVAVQGEANPKWVLLVSINPGAPNGGSGTQYFVGDFDGKTFTLDPGFKNDLDREKALWIDYGRDNYAGVTWSGIPASDGRTLFIGWMSNWNYGQAVPTTAWRSAMTLARELQLLKTRNGYRLASQPVRELEKYSSKSVKKENLKLGGETVIVKNAEIDLSAAYIRINIKELKEDSYTFSLYNDEGDRITFGLNAVENFFFINRTASGITGFSEKFASSVSKAPSNGKYDELDIAIVVDKTSVELFYNKGETVMTELFFPRAPMSAFSVTSLKPDAGIGTVTIDQLTFN